MTIGDRIIHCFGLSGLIVTLLFATSVDAQVRVVLTSSPGSELSTAIANGQQGEALLQNTVGDATSWARLTDNLFVTHVVDRTIIATYPDSASAAAAIDRLRLSSEVSSVEYSRLFSVDTIDLVEANEPFADSTGHLDVINARQVWDLSTGSRDVRVAVVDTGLDFQHPDFQGQIWINPGEDLNGNGRFDEADIDGVDNDGNGIVDDVRGYDFVNRVEILDWGDYRIRDYDATDDGSGHGTYVSGIVAAAQNGIGISGVAPGITLVPLRAFSADGNGADVDIASAIIYAADQGFEVINLSFGDVYDSNLIRNAIDYATIAGSVIVASAGNNGGDAPHYPSDYPEVISVVWLNAEGTGQASRATYGVGIDVGAPGTSVFTTRHPFNIDNPTDEDLYGRVSGSSMAAPMVSATAALIKTLIPDATPQMVRNAIVSNASDIGNPGWDHTTASGLLNVSRAVGSTLSSRIEISSPENSQGFSLDNMQIRGSVIHPDLATWSLQYTAGDSGSTEVSWEDIPASVAGQAYNEVLGILALGQLSEGVYTLRLRVELTDGRDIEDRRRFFVDRSSPLLQIRLLEHAVIEGAHGIVLDAEADDLSTVILKVGNSPLVESDRLSTRHGVQWSDTDRLGGVIPVSITATNTAGLSATVDTTIALPVSAVNSNLFSVSSLDIPAGFLLDRIVDFDNDGLGELVYNRFEDGWVGDTLLFAEYDGNDFRRAHAVVANVFPRDIGDADGDGLVEVLGQIGPASLILEQTSGEGYPGNALLVDTTGISNPSGTNAVWAAGLFDVDGDGRDEVISHNTVSTRILSVENGSYTVRQQIENPTSVSDSELSSNAFEQPAILKGDFDGDGLVDILLGDADGDWIMLEQDGSGSMRVSWTYETDRYGAATRFGSGDFDGDGTDDFVTYARNWLPATGRNDQEPDIGVYYFWRSDGNDNYIPEYTVAVPGLIDRYGSIGSLDVDNDGDDETIIVDSPGLFVLDRLPDGSRQLVYSLDESWGEEAAGPHSSRIVSGSFDGSLNEFVVFSNADGTMSKLEPNAPASPVPPVWVSANPGGPDTAELRWYHPSADSFAVFRSTAGSSFENIVTTVEENYMDSTAVLSEYFVQAWQGGDISGPGETIQVLPHTRASVTQVSYPDSNRIQILFSYPLSQDLSRHQLQLSQGSVASTLVLSDGGRLVSASFDSADAVASDTLFFLDIDDVDRLLVEPAWINVQFPSGSSNALVLRDWMVELPGDVQLSFNKPVDPASVLTSNFEIGPVGSVSIVQADPDNPVVLNVEVDGINLAASGISPVLRMTNLVATDGSGLAPEGNEVRLFVQPSGLDNVVVYPNPVDLRVHAGEASIAGLPADSNVDILSIDGVLVTSLPRTENAGELKWNLRDRSGALVASGVYLLRITEVSGLQVFKKLVVVR